MQMENPPVELSASDREELHLLYSASTSDITFFKQQQWTVTNHTLVLQGALLFITYEILGRHVTTWQLWLLAVLTWASLVAGISMVIRLQGSVVGRRARLERVRANFGDPFNKAWLIYKVDDDIHKLHATVMLVSSVVVTWLLMRTA